MACKQLIMHLKIKTINRSLCVCYLKVIEEQVSLSTLCGTTGRGGEGTSTSFVRGCVVIGSEN